MVGSAPGQNWDQVHAHSFRHTFGTAATKLGWHFEHLRAAMGHSDYKVLQIACEAGFADHVGRRVDWTDLIVENPGLGWT